MCTMTKKLGRRRSKLFGIGVANFGGYLLDKYVITMSFVLKDEHVAQNTVLQSKELLLLLQSLEPKNWRIQMMYMIWPTVLVVGSIGMQMVDDH